MSDESGGTPQDPTQPQAPAEGPTQPYMRPGESPTQPHAPMEGPPTEQFAPVGATPPPGPATPTAPRRRSRRRLAALVIAALVVLGGVAVAAVLVFNSLAGTGDVLVKMVPADSNIYAAAYFNPGAGQKLNLQTLAHKFPAVGNKNLPNTVDRLLDQALAPTGLSFTRDIKPWLGTQISVAGHFSTSGGPTTAAVLIASKDDSAAMNTLTKAEKSSLGQGLTWSTEQHSGVTVAVGRDFGQTKAAWAITDHTVLLSNSSDEIDAVIDTDQGKAANLGDDAAYKKTLGGLPKSFLGIVYVNLADVIGQIQAALPSPVQGALSNAAGFKAFQGLGMTLSAQPNGASLDVAVSIDASKLTSQQRDAITTGSHDNALLSSVPSGAYGVFGVTGLGPALQSLLHNANGSSTFQQVARALDLNAIVPHLTGDAALEVEPGSTRFPAGSLLIGTNDTGAMQAFLDRAAHLAVGSTTGLSLQHETYKGVTITFVPVSQVAQFGVEPAYAVTGGVGILGSSPTEVKRVIDARSGSNLTSAPSFTDAESSVAGPKGTLLYLDVPGVLGAIRSVVPTFTLPGNVASNLGPVKALLLTIQGSTDVEKAHLFVEIH